MRLRDKRWQLIMMEKLLRVNLSNRNTLVEEIPNSVLTKYVGGKGLAAYYIYREIPKNCDPLSAENKLMFFVGPLTGLFPGFDRYVVCSKSPLTHTFSDSYAGGWFATAIRKNGFLGLIIEGKADKLVSLKIDGDRVTIEDATEFSGKSPTQVDKFLPGYRVIAIGLAGENLVKYACIIGNAGKSGRSGVAGRGGLGAVMGSKNLKMVAFKEISTPFLLEENVIKLRKKIIDALKNEIVPDIGIGGNLKLVDFSAKAKVLPIKNFQRGFINEYRNINEAAVKKLIIGKSTCNFCPIACGVKTKIKSGPYSGLILDRIEYETIAMCGSNCGHKDLASIIKLNYLCNEYGLDTISTGNVVGFFMECVEKGLVNYDIKFGDISAHTDLIEKIAKREGIGDILAEGVAAASKIFGGKTKSFALHVKGLEIPGYDPRGSISMGLAYGTSDRGACHLRAFSISKEAFLNVNAGVEIINPFLIEGKAKLVKDLQDINAALWCLIACDNLGFSTVLVEKMFNTVGIKMTDEEFIRAGERICNLIQLFNHREGFSRRDDYLPPRLYEIREDTGWQIPKEDYEKMLDEYYQLRKWGQDGMPSNVILNEVGLQF